MCEPSWSRARAAAQRPSDQGVAETAAPSARSGELPHAHHVNVALGPGAGDGVVAASGRVETHGEVVEAIRVHVE